MQNQVRFLKTILVHKCQTFKNEKFNGDTNPDNILLMFNGRLVIIDYDQLKYLSKEEFTHLSELVIDECHYNLECVVKKVDEMEFIKEQHQIAQAYLQEIGIVKLYFFEGVSNLD
ncbi:hypothetical protein RFI_25256 [Reticulomyxa filosa]|uniref:Uncharacterized protein n=1 Tax=Reticulomyxa filosa TaxID=46433 RepID=X6MDZ6_RETFI|nr:hypothetical protein RFI_25256 [Reticulomyxa filosa]|eukprot:ETO12119.1 hypothetical protein RFI_25256 [Reticulomyxa filosa]